MRVWADLQRLRRAVAGLYEDDDEQASFELAQSARGFSRRTREQVDDKLSFSAVLMRAGEVDAANRLIDELERDVRAEEAALLEQMNEVRVARAMRRDAPTRARLARVLATATVGAVLMASSALGTALTGALREDDRTGRVAPELFAAGAGRDAPAPAAAVLARDPFARMRKVKIAEAEVLLSPRQLRMLEKITAGAAGDGAVEQLLRQLQLPPELAAEVRKVLTAASGIVAAVPTPVVEVPSPPRPLKKKAKKKVQKQAPPQEAPAPEPEPEPSPSPSPSEDEGGKKGVDGNGSGSESESSGPDLPQLP